MRGRRETRRARVPFVVLGLVLGLALPAAGGADPSRQADALRARQSTLADRSHAALLSLYALDSKLAATRARLDALRARAAAIRAQQNEAAHAEAIAHQVWQQSVTMLGAHLRTLYEQGEPDTISVVLGATSVDDALAKLDTLQRSAELSRHAITQTIAAQRSLAALRAKLSAAAAEVSALEEQTASVAAALERTRADRVAYLANLQRQRTLTQKQLVGLQAVAQRIAVRSQVVAVQTSQPAAAVSDQSSPTPWVDSRQVIVTATGYSLGGHTATGMPVGWGVVAVDPSVIPLGTRMTIPGYGEGVAADTGTAVHGSTIDLWFPTVGQALAWGRRTLTITLH